MDQQQQSRWQPTRKQLLWAGATVGLVLLTIAVVIGYRYDITLWDWLKLLIVPVVIAGGGLWFNRQQRERELKIARDQRERDVELAERRTQDEALQAYLDQMSAMLLPNKDQPSLYRAGPSDGLSSVARARTLTVLPRLDGDRKARVVQFLYESGLITTAGRPILERGGVVSLSRKDSVVQFWRESGLYAAQRRILDLRGSDLSGVKLGGASLKGIDLRGANLRGANLFNANLRGANLSRADLRGATLGDADLRLTDLRLAMLSAPIIIFRDPSEPFSASGADLRHANLRWANLGGAFLQEALLGDANLREANLSAALGQTNVQLAVQAALEETIMPNGQKYEDWLKSKDRGEDGENSNTS